MSIAAKLAWLVLLTATSGMDAWALVIKPSPTEYEVSAVPGGILVIENTEQESLQVEVSVVRILADESGEPQELSAAESLSVRPGPSKIEPGGSQSFAITWRDDQAADASGEFFVDIKQSQDNQGFNDAGSFTFRYALGSLLPQQRTDAVQLRIRRVRQRQSLLGPILELELVNEGTKNAYLWRADFAVRGADGRGMSFGPNDIMAVLDNDTLFPGDSIILAWPLEAPLTEPLNASVNLHTLANALRKR